MCISDALAAYTVQLQADGRSVHTIRQAERHVRLLARWAGDPPVAELGHEHVARFLASDVVQECAGGGPRKASSANAIRSSVRGFCAFVHGAGYAATNAARLVRRARTRPPMPKALSDADAGKLLAALDGARTAEERRDRALFVTMLRCGLRLGSALGLDVGDIDFDAGEIHVRVLKNGGEDLVVMPADVADLLREHAGGRASGPVFLASHGGRIGARHVRRRLEQWSARAGIASTHPHALRHTCGQRIYRRTKDVLVVASALLHRSVASAAVYARADRAAVRAAMG
jgi:integrase